MLSSADAHVFSHSIFLCIIFYPVESLVFSLSPRFYQHITNFFLFPTFSVPNENKNSPHAPLCCPFCSWVLAGPMAWPCSSWTSMGRDSPQEADVCLLASSCLCSTLSLSYSSETEVTKEPGLEVGFNFITLARWQTSEKHKLTLKMRLKSVWFNKVWCFSTPRAIRITFICRRNRMWFIATKNPFD